MYKVLKFGGSSVANAERINNIISILKPRILSGEKLTVVFSAFGGVTDLLLEMSELASQGKDKYIALFHQFKDRHNEVAKALLSSEAYTNVCIALEDNNETLKELLKGIFLVRESSLRTQDYVLSFGERNANFIIANAMKETGLPTLYLDARKIIKTNKDFGNAKVNFKLTNQAIQDFYNECVDSVPIVTGFIGSDIGGLTTTLGRGGSDYTAAIIAAALEAQVLEIWTDVDGVLTCDPRKVKKAYTIPKLSYAEAMEMSHFGAKVIYPPTIQPALKKGIPIYIKNTFNPTFVGTLIDKEFDINSKSPIKGISSLGGVALISVHGSGIHAVNNFSSRLFAILVREKIGILLITQASSEQSISIAISDKDAKNVEEIIKTEFERELNDGFLESIKIEKDLCVVAIIGEQMKNVPGISGKLFSSLGKNGINVRAIAQGSSELNISFIINSHDESKALNAIHDSFFLSDVKRIHLFMVGVGLIGSTLIKQIDEQKQFLSEELGLEIVISGLANTKKMLFDQDMISLDNWKQLLDDSNRASDLESFVDTMINMNLPNSIFIDNTASGVMPSFYKQILSASISISTPNKVAASSSYAQYSELKKTAKRKNAHFLFETNVGAGLPVLSTIKSMIQSGDRVEQIEAVLSGSLSYIFNNFKPGVSFTSLVKEAREKGYTEPDPRDDLSGADVKRKIIILARESGYAIEPDDVVIKPLLSKECIGATSIANFFTALKNSDGKYNELIELANRNNHVLRFVASFNHGKIVIGLQEVSKENPFFSLAGSDNMIVFTTKRYKQFPLVIKGPGAGAEVTAAGVFAEIISISLI